MRLSADGKALLHHFEACGLKAYPDPKTGGKPWTIGWGHTGEDVYPGAEWNQEQADEAFDEDVAKCEQGVEQLLAGHPTYQCQFDALVSFAYNVGLDIDKDTKAEGLGDSTLLRQLLLGHNEAASDEFLKWVSPGSSVERGLRRRRVAERALFTGDDWRAVLDAHIAGGG